MICGWIMEDVISKSLYLKAQINGGHSAIGMKALTIMALPL